MKLTAHMLVKNEENWVWYAITSTLPEVDKLIIYDTGSSDQTVDIINQIYQRLGSKKIDFVQRRITDKNEVVKIRQEMVVKTETDWFLLVDGDEVWNKPTLKSLKLFLSKQPDKTIGVAMRTRNCVGDIYHYLPNNLGHYHILGHSGHLTIRAYRRHPEFSWRGTYPLEGYTNQSGQIINDLPEKLAFFDDYYWHMTHLPRTSSTATTWGFRSNRLHRGITIESTTQLPEVFSDPDRPDHFNPLVHRSLGYELVASLVSPIKNIKARLA